MNPKGLAAIVTGGASGLGRAAALALAKAGAKVAVLDLDQAGAEKVARDIVRGIARGAGWLEWQDAQASVVSV